MKTLKGWDAYVQDAHNDDLGSIELPLTADEKYVIPYPSRRQGKAITAAQKAGDVDAMLIALLGTVAGERVAEISADSPGYVLDEFLLDVMRKFGFVEDDDSDVEAGKSSSAPQPSTGARKPGKPRTTSPTVSS